MTDAIAARPPTWFWLVAILALLWSGFLCFSALTVIGSPGTAMPRLVSLLFAVAAVGELTGAILLLVRRRWALWALAVALVAMLVWAGDLFLNLPIQLLQLQVVIVTAAILILNFIFVITARAGSARGWLR